MSEDCALERPGWDDAASSTKRGRHGRAGPAFAPLEGGVETQADRPRPQWCRLHAAGDAERIAEREEVAARIRDIVDIERDSEAPEIEPAADLSLHEAALDEVERRADTQMGSADIAQRRIQRHRHRMRQGGPEMDGAARASAGDV